ncbi:MAG: fibronectin type III domain-containing protein [Patescibacteria group bacterium]
MRRSKIPTIFGIFILVLGLAAGVLLVRGQKFFRLGATAEFAPKDVRISNIADTSFTISWVTDKETSGFIKWGQNKDSLEKTELDEIKSQSFVHLLTLRGLSPETSYFFKINSGGEDFDSGGIPWQVTTGSSLDTPAKTSLVSGVVLTSTGQPAKNALLYLTVGGGSLLSTIASQNGTWVVPISSARTQDFSDYVVIEEKNSLIEISVNAGPDGVATAQIYPQSARPAPSIILGQVHDFKNLPPSAVSEIPKASIGLPEESTPSSGFEVEEKPTTPSVKTVTLESVDEGEIVTSTDPEFFGEGPAGVTLTISLESEPITDTVAVPSNGDWKWSPPQGLTEGAHKITITWRDSSGILRILTRTFIVQAAEGPAFESTPSASPTSTPQVSPTASPTPSPTATGTTIPTAPATSTAAPVPESGSLTPTIALSIMGVGVLAFAFFVWKKSEI